jgi:prepilin-type N-terminal cleavage/methylation domain-containing protein
MTARRSAFTLIEMLVASTIFAIVVVISAGVFGSSAKMQVNTQSSIHNQELSSQINNKIFDDLKSATGWGKIKALVNGATINQVVKVKGIAFLQLTTTSNLKISGSISDGSNLADIQNLIIAFSGPETSTTTTIFYFKGPHLYRKILAPIDFSTAPPISDNQLFSGSDLINPDNELKTDSSTIRSVSISGQNYLSNPDPALMLSPLNKVQPLINLDLVVADDKSDNITLETKTSFSSRNYIEEID